MKLSSVSVAVLTALATGTVHANSADTEENASGEATNRHVETVVVTANKFAELPSDTAGSVAIYRGEDIQKKGATELYDALTNEPGVSVTGGAGRPQNITIRGMSGNRILIVEDGVPVADGFGAADLNDKAGRNSFDIASAKQIQVVKGASSTSYGSGALGGAVIVTSLSADDLLRNKDLYADAQVTYSELSDKGRVGSRLALRHGDTSALLDVSYWEGEETRNYQQDLYNRTLDGGSASLRLDHYVSDRWKLSARAKLYREEASRQEGTASIQPDGKWDIKTFDQAEKIETTQFWLGSEYHAQQPWLETLNTKLYYRNTDFTQNTNRLMTRWNRGINEQRRVLDDRRFQDQSIGWSVDANAEQISGDVVHTLVYGGVLETAYHERPVTKTTLDWNGVTVGDTQPFAPARSYSLGVYAQDAMSIGQWRVMLGLRADAYRLSADDPQAIGMASVADNNSAALSPSASVAYHWTPAFNTYLSYKHGYRAPEYDKSYGYSNHASMPGMAFVVLPNPSLDAETSDSFELGAKYDDGKLRLYTAAYYNRFSQFIDIADKGFNAETGLFEKRYENLNGVKTYGVEASAAYAFTDQWQAKSQIGWISGKDDDDEYVRNLAPLEGSVSLHFDNQSFNGYTRLNWADQMTRTPMCYTELGTRSECAQTSGWASVDLGLGYQFSSQASINLNVYNVLDREYIRYQDVAGISESQTRFSTEPGRYFTLNARYAF